MSLEKRIKDVLSSCTTWDQLLVGVKYCWNLIDSYTEKSNLSTYLYLVDIYNTELKESVKRIGGK